MRHLYLASITALFLCGCSGGFTSTTGTGNALQTVSVAVPGGTTTSAPALPSPSSAPTSTSTSTSQSAFTPSVLPAFDSTKHYFDVTGAQVAAPTAIGGVGSQVVASGNDVFAATACGTFYSADSGSSYTSLLGSTDALASLFLFVDGSNLYSTGEDGIYLSTNAGQTFSPILNLATLENECQASPNLFAECYTNPPILPSPTIVAASGSTILAWTTWGPVQSQDAGKTFNPVKGLGFSVAQFALANGRVYAIGAGSPLAFYVSVDHGSSFTMNSTVPGFVAASKIWASGSMVAFMAADFSSNKAKFYLSNDGGVTFSINPINIDYLSAQSLVFQNGGFWITFEGGLYVSRDNGTSWTQVFIGMPMGNSDSAGEAQSVATNGSVLTVMTSLGVYSSADQGATFPLHKAFSSSYCVNPWWYETTGIAANAATILRPDWSSTDGGATFIHRSGNGIHNTVEQMVALGNAFVAILPNSTSSGDNPSPIFTTTDLGNNFSSQGTSFSNSGQILSTIGMSEGGAYLSLDGANLLAPVSSYASTNGLYLTDAVSSGGQIVAATADGSVLVFTNGDLTKSFKISIHKRTLSSVNYPQVAKIGSVIYAWADQLYASYDNGSSFSIVAGSPLVPANIFQVNNDILITSETTIPLYVIKAGTTTAQQWVGELQ